MNSNLSWSRRAFVTSAMASLATPAGLVAPKPIWGMVSAEARRPPQRTIAKGGPDSVERVFDLQAILSSQQAGDILHQRGS
jgi:hypothetical protein